MITRGKLANQTGCNIETIRYYEKVGLIPKPMRTSSGYRQYDDEHIRLIHFIQRAKALGFSGERIQGLLELNDAHHTRADVKALTERHLDEISEKIRDLQKIKKRLGQISSYCDGSAKSAESCPILESLFEDFQNKS
jgi:MerR family mercuric resistance operon transcriptional regulator